MTTCGCLGSGWSSGSGAESIDERMREFISVEVTRGILDATLMLFGTIKDGIWSLGMRGSGIFEPRLM